MKKKSLLEKSVGVIVTLGLCIAVFAGCGNSVSKDESASNKDTVTKTQNTGSSISDTAAGNKVKISVGIGNAFSPFCFLDENGKEAGYDYEVIKAIASHLSDKYDFAINPDDFSNLLIGLDTSKYNMAIHHFGYTPERAKNYLYAKEADMYFGNFRIGFIKDKKNITDMKSLTGLTVATASGSMSENLILAWNEKNPNNPIKMAYSADKETWHAALTSGLCDAYIATEYDIDTFSKQYDNFLAMSDYKVTADNYDSGTYFVYNKGSEKIQTDIDQAIVDLRKDGTLSKLSKKWLGNDYTQNPTK
jgi:ABC-type amino acid transport substrate-binding protein